MFNPPHPGEMLKELYMDPLNLTVTETAKGLGVTRKSLSELLNGHNGISSEMALKLAKAFDTTPEYWMNLQWQYKLYKAKEKVDLTHIKTFYESSVTDHLVN